MTAFAISGLISLTGLLFCAQSGEETLAAPSGLLVELLRHPESALITSRNPHFSWIVNDRARGAVQTSYQIQMASQTDLVEGGAPDVWDSGKVSSARSVGVAFGGKPLASNSTYWWRVRTWNASDAASAYSEAQQFHTGDLDAARAWPSESRWRRLAAAAGCRTRARRSLGAAHRASLPGDAARPGHGNPRGNDWRCPEIAAHNAPVLGHGTGRRHCRRAGASAGCTRCGSGGSPRAGWRQRIPHSADHQHSRSHQGARGHAHHGSANACGDQGPGTGLEQNPGNRAAH